MLWKKLIERMVRTDSLWRGLSERRGWGQYLFKNKPPDGTAPPNSFYRALYPKIIQDIEIWDKNTLECKRILTGHTGSVLCLQYDERVIITGSSDSTVSISHSNSCQRATRAKVKVWNTSTCEFVRTLNGHKRGIACLQYRDRLVVSGSSDNTISYPFCTCKPIPHMAKDMIVSSDPIQIQEHSGRVFRLQFDEFQIVSSSHDDTILIWDFLNDPAAQAESTPLHRFLGTPDVQDVIEEMKEEQRSLSSVEMVSVWQLLRDRSVRWQTLSVVVVNAGMQLSGIDAIWFYTNTIFENAGIPVSQIPYTTVGTGAIEVVAGLIGTALPWMRYVSVVCVVGIIAGFCMGPGSKPSAAQ
ncbi:solute carrier family facilitated glucose transporter member hypothetical protein [Limosa lapponica baueri]|uniref:Uncharacterized protein n=1 Tax=Limosa lapponica baueri TaxID=1758121 RepID=A0A2I0TNJ9_LIMLA|nr:solute carrier family facilitated glucose transporter member hypothetical protein [Limosa lapponica baueri]